MSTFLGSLVSLYASIVVIVPMSMSYRIQISSPVIIDSKNLLLYRYDWSKVKVKLRFVFIRKHLFKVQRVQSLTNNLCWTASSTRPSVDWSFCHLKMFVLWWSIASIHEAVNFAMSDKFAHHNMKYLHQISIRWWRLQARSLQLE